MKTRKLFFWALMASVIAIISAAMVVSGCTEEESKSDQPTNTDTSDTNSGTSDGGTTAPSAPTGVTATVQSASSIKVSWSSVTGATSYKVYYEIGSSTTKNLASTISSTSYTHSELTAGQTYYYYIKALNSKGESGYSAYASATPSSGSSGGGNTGGGSDGGTTAVPGKPTLNGSNPTTSTCTFSWSFPSSANVTEVKIEGKLATGSWTTIATRTTSSGSYSLSPYRNYIQPSGATDATFGQIAYLVWIRVSGKNSAGWGATRSIFFDTLLIDVYIEN
jgi:hypothetical protein